MSFSRWSGEEDLMYICNGILFSHKKRWYTDICDNMIGPWEYHAKSNKSVRKSWEPHGFIHMWGLKLKVTNKQIRKTNRHRQQCGDYQRRGGRGG